MHGRYTTLTENLHFDRRELLRAAGAGAALLGGRLVLGVPTAAGQQAPEVSTNIDEFLKVPRGPHALPGPFPGRVVKVVNLRALRGDTVDARVVREMVEQGIARLTGKNLRASFALLFSRDDVIGLKVNPVGAPLISTRPEVAEAVIAWLVDNKVPRSRIVIWDRFEEMLPAAGFTPQRFPGVRIVGMQRMAEEGQSFRDASGEHISAGNFDREAVYLARGVVGKGVRGYRDDEFYLNQHVFAGEASYFGRLVTRELTKIVNLAAYKNTGNGISMATKNIGYAAICNTGRLHQPLFFRVCTEVLAAPWIRDKLVLNITDGLRGQYDGGPDKNEQFVYANNALYFATDPFALDMVCHRELVAVRKARGVTVNEHPRFVEYLHYAERLGLGAVGPGRLHLVEVRA
ncbi:MAG TPA: DUF362 domain-containing protein [Thermoanaerobaculaceae bacterium]|nr:DUF362 domain-containing protein [Thermoanaerobaculaceae bacterium]HRS14758.1 DUF362 domain-containing protein [Thermoanaerobaculaceae bacterium]